MRCPSIGLLISSTIPISLILLSLTGCREDAQSPTEPAAQPALAAASAPLPFLQLSGSGFNSCGVTTDFRAFCWGFNDNGELGNGTTASSLIPVAVAGGHQFNQVSTDGHHSCALTSDGKAYCWGLNADGELGDGTRTRRLAPVLVLGGLRFSQLQAGHSHTCAVTKSDGLAYCWGDNSAGALGDGTTTDRLKPVRVAGGHRFRQVSGGDSHTCGTTTASQAYCWGWNRFGQIGDSGAIGVRTRPVLVAGHHAFIQVNAGFQHSCGVTSNHLAFCWGFGGQGQIGDGKKLNRFFPKAVASSVSFNHLSLGSGHSCGLTTGSLAYCWGENTSGQLGDNTTTQRLTPVPGFAGLTFNQLSAGGFHTCGVTPGAVAWCWGDNGFGQLGDGSNGNSPLPVSVQGPG